MKHILPILSILPILPLLLLHACKAPQADSIPIVEVMDMVELKEAHVGDLEIDTRLLDSYGRLPDSIRSFYLEAREAFATDSAEDFSDDAIIHAARKAGLPLMGGPMLGRLSSSSVHIWMRPATDGPLPIRVFKPNGDEVQRIAFGKLIPGKAIEIPVTGLSPNTRYAYEIGHQNTLIARGSFTTAPDPEASSQDDFRLVFGSCFHKIGLHNPNLVQQIRRRDPHAMLLLGDIAVDDRENDWSMHRSDYLLRDVSAAWSELAAHVPLYAAWDDHDYLNNDLSGIPDGFSPADRDSLRGIWQENWNNPGAGGEGIYFSTRLGPVEVIMLDTRSCRTIEKRGEADSYLGREQMDWLKNLLLNSNAPFKIISSGTMWSDDVSNGKDSWGTWDTRGREEIFSFIEQENIPGVLLISGDRHGARAFRIPRPSGHSFYEFEAATLGGVPGPPAMAPDSSRQLFGYHGNDAIAFGEFTFNTKSPDPELTFRLIDQCGSLLEEHFLSYEQLFPAPN